MLVPLRPLDAYRTDLGATPGRDTFGSRDGAWLCVAQAVDRLATATEVETFRRKPGPLDPGASRRPALLDALDAALASVGDPFPLEDADQPAGTPGSDAAATEGIGGPGARAEGKGRPPLADRVLRFALAVEDAGALRLGYTILSSVGRAWPVLPDDVAAQAAVQRGRIARKLGSLDVAESLYRDAVRLGRRARHPAAVIRGWHGLAIVARRRGNYPGARALYQRALAAATRQGLDELVRDSHHGLLIAAGSAGDAATALRHGWEALRRMDGDRERQAEILSNLGAVCSVAGAYQAGTGAYAAALAQSDVPRVRLPALGGLAYCLAHVVAQPTPLADLEARVRHEMAREALPYEHALGLSLVAESWAVFAARAPGEAAGADCAWADARRVAREAIDDARQFCFHEIVHTLEQVLTAAGAADDKAPTDVTQPPRVQSPGAGGTSEAGDVSEGTERPAHARGRAGRVLRTLERYALDAPATAFSVFDVVLVAG